MSITYKFLGYYHTKGHFLVKTGKTFKKIFSDSSYLKGIEAVNPPSKVFYPLNSEKKPSLVIIGNVQEASMAEAKSS
jgi:hypothetical protein